MTSKRKPASLTAAKLLTGIKPGETVTAVTLARRHTASTASVMTLLTELIRRGELERQPSNARTMRVHRPAIDAGQPIVRAIPTPDNGVFRGTLTGYSEAHALRAELCMLVRRS